MRSRKRRWRGTFSGPLVPRGRNGDTGATGPGNGARCTLGEILLTAGSIANGVPADGRLLQIAENITLFQLIGTTYGGDGLKTFALPDL